ncbi:uroporphyrinogen decarboxylase family protein [bacterium]|nr:uroporphyrinogen decarboxylase family protein [bacterium]MBU1651182.1 uroporphyrinogen decarboxylase family protein [bacterium]
MPGEMNPRERWGLLLIDEIPDRPPVYPLVTAHAAAVYGCDLTTYVTNGKVMAEAQLAAQRKYGHEGLSVFSEVGIIAEAMGSRYHYRQYDVPILDQPIIDNHNQIEKLQAPDPGSTGRLSVYLDAIDTMYEAAGDILPIFAFIPCSFTTAAGLRGVEEFLMDTVLAPEAAHAILDISLQAAIRFCDACVLAGALPVLVDPLASGSVISRRTYQEFALPYQVKLISYLHRYDLDITLHVCGDTSKMLDLIPQSGADLFSLDQAELPQAVAEMGERVRLVGNLSPSSLLPSSHQVISDCTHRILSQGIPNPKGFVLSTGCEVPIKCQPEKLQALIQVGKQAHYDFQW